MRINHTASSNPKKYWEDNFTDETAASYMETYGEGKNSPLRLKLASYLKPEDWVLDVGCGPGWNFETFLENGPAVYYRGMDYSKRFIKVASERVKPLNIFEVGDVRDIPAQDGSFDVVILQDVLEHTNGYAYDEDKCSKCLEASNGFTVRGNEDNIEGWNVSKKTAQNQESQPKVNLDEPTKELDVIGTTESNAVKQEAEENDTSTRMATSKSMSMEQEKQSIGSSWNRNSEENLKDGKVSTTSMGSEEITAQKTSSSGLEELDTDKEPQMSSAPTASNRTCNKHGPIQEALRVARRLVLVTFWHLAETDDPHINDDGADTWGAWYDKRDWEKFLNKQNYPWFHKRIPRQGEFHDMYVIDKEL